jgi:catechol 2,3-dioxygenase-like lactoylglutathione lyase family enzyme
MLENSDAFNSFAVPDLDQAQEFYGETLGLKVTRDAPMLITLHLGDDSSTMVYLKPDFEPATYTVLNFPVADIDQAVERLSERGVEFERYEGFEQDEKGIARGDQGGPPIAWFTDPAGNILAVLQQGR